jgi:hypothetical protein
VFGLFFSSLLQLWPLILMQINGHAQSLGDAPEGIRSRGGEASSLLKSAAAGGGAIGFRLVGRAEVAVSDIDGAHRYRYSQRYGYRRRNDKLKRDYSVWHRQLELALTYPTEQKTTFR